MIWNQQTRLLQLIEYGDFLLRGWTSFTSWRGVQELPFDTRTIRPVEGLLREVSKQNRPPLDRHIARCYEWVAFSGVLDTEFKNAEFGALDCHESLLTRLFLRSAPLGNVIDVSVRHTGLNCGVVCRLKPGPCRCVPSPEEQSGDAATFADRALSMVNSFLFKETD
jgi:hypothetical protein